MNTFANQIEEAIINKQRENLHLEGAEWERRKNTTNTLSQFNALYTETETKKVVSFHEKTGLLITEIYDLAYNQLAWFSVIFKKDASKQNVGEKMQIENIKKIYCNATGTTNHTQGKNCIAIINGTAKVIKRTQSKKTKNKTATFDFEFDYDNISQRFFCKYTTNTGGSQNHTKGEAITFIKYINKLGENAVGKWIMVLDGSFWTSEIIEELESFIKYDNIIITNSDYLNTKHVNNKENSIITF